MGIKFLFFVCNECVFCFFSLTFAAAFAQRLKSTNMKIKILTLLVACLYTMSMRAQTTVTPPSDATVEQWVATFNMHYYSSGGSEVTEAVSEPMQVATSGTDIYFHLPNPITGNSWVKGTFDGATATFPRGQYIGSYGGSPAYLDAMDDSGLGDLNMYYMADKGQFYTLQYVLINSSLTAAQPWCYYTDMTVTKQLGGDDHDTNADGTFAPPATATVENWVLSCQNVNPYNESQKEDVSDKVKVAFNEDKVYIQGFSGHLPSAWVKGSATGDKVTCTTRQYIGSYGGKKLYVIGYDGSECDLVLTYNEARDVMTASAYLLVIDEDDNVVQQLTDILLYRDGGSDPTDELVTPPAGLHTQAYECKSTSIEYDYDGTVSGMTQVSWDVKVGLSGQTVYIQGLCPYFPESWVMGTRNSDGEVTFLRNQFFGQDPLHQNYYLSGMIFGELSDLVLTYNNSSDTYSGGSYYMVFNSRKDQLAPFGVHAGITLTRTADGITEYAAEESSRTEYYDMEGRPASTHTKGMVIQRQRSDDGKMHTTKVIRR